MTDCQKKRLIFPKTLVDKTTKKGKSQSNKRTNNPRRRIEGSLVKRGKTKDETTS